MSKGRILFTDDNKSALKYQPKIQGKVLFADDQKPLNEATMFLANNKNNEIPGWAGVQEDVLNKGTNFIQGIPGALKALPGELKGALTQQAGRAGQNALAGLGQFGHNILSKPGDIRDYLVRKQLASPESHSFRLPESILPKDFNYAEGVGLEGQQPGDALIQGLPEMLASPGELSLLRKIPGLRPGSRHQKALTKALKDMEATKQKHKVMLGEGEAHGHRAAQQFLDTIEGPLNPITNKRQGGLRTQVGSQYDKLAEDMMKENVMLQTTPDLKAIQKEVAKLGKGVSGEEKEKFLKILTAADSKKRVNGADALATYRELKHQKGQAFKHAYTGGTDISPSTREQWIKKGEQLEALEKRMREHIGTQIGTKYLDKLKKIDTEYATKIAPLYKNSAYQKMLKHEKTPQNMMDFLHGSTSGNKTLNQVVSKNPELQRLLVGQKFAANPEKLGLPNEVVEPYAAMNPHIAKIIKEQKKINHVREKLVPRLTKLAENARGRKNIRRGVLGGGAGALGAMGIETALGRDWKKDIPLLTSLLALKRSGRK